MAIMVQRGSTSIPEAEVTRRETLIGDAGGKGIK